jgi:hypothetical protein
MAALKFNVFGRLILVERVADGWQVFYFGNPRVVRMP